MPQKKVSVVVEVSSVKAFEYTLPKDAKTIVVAGRKWTDDKGIGFLSEQGSPQLFLIGYTDSMVVYAAFPIRDQTEEEQKGYRAEMEKLSKDQLVEGSFFSAIMQKYWNMRVRSSREQQIHNYADCPEVKEIGFRF